MDFSTTESVIHGVPLHCARVGERHSKKWRSLISHVEGKSEESESLKAAGTQWTSENPSYHRARENLREAPSLTG